MAPFHTLLGVHEPFDPECTWVTSWLFPPHLFACLRLLLALYALVTAIVALALVIGASQFTYFSYFTNLSYLGLVAWYFASGVQTLAFALGNRKEYPLQRWPSVLQLLHTLLFSTIVTYPVIVTVVVWAILYTPGTFWDTPFDAWSNISQHAMNTAFALFEVVFSNIVSMPWMHLVFIVLGLAFYLCVAYITYHTQRFYTYAFLDPSTEHGLLAGYIVGVGVGGCIVWIIIRYLIVLRVRLTQRRRAERTAEDGRAINAKGTSV